MSSTPPTLSDMPELVLKRIMAECGFMEIQCLRKVCYTLRNYIDDAKPDLKLIGISVIVATFQISVKYETKDRIYVARYEKFGNKCRIRGKVLEEDAFGLIAFKDLGTILELQKSIIENFEIDWVDVTMRNFDKYCEILESSLKKRSLKVKKLWMKPYDETQIMSILPYLVPGILKEIELRLQFKLTSENIVKMEQWKRAQKVSINRGIVFKSMLDFMNFSKVSACVERFSIEDLVGMKETFFHNSTFEYFAISFNDITELKALTRYLGDPIENPMYEIRFDSWYSKLPGWKRVLEISNFGGHSLRFRLSTKKLSPAKSKIKNFLDLKFE